jgi:predicted nucleotidyltransferase
MEIPSIVSKIPEGSRVFLFGSVLTGRSPADVDVLVVYDPIRCPPADAYTQHSALCEALAAALDLRVHATLLTEGEERATELGLRTKAIPLELALGKLTKRFRQVARGDS